VFTYFYELIKLSYITGRSMGTSGTRSRDSFTKFSDGRQLSLCWLHVVI